MFQISVTIYKQEAFMFITYLHRIYIRDNKGVFFYEPLIKQRNPHNDHIRSAKTNIKTVDLNGIRLYVYYNSFRISFYSSFSN
jgi:hypothetical protein